MKVLLLGQLRPAAAMTALMLVVAAPRFAISRQSLVPPTIVSVLPENVLPGTSFTAVISGSDLQAATSVMVSGTGVAASIVSNTSSSTLTVSISISESAPTGLRSLTVVTPAGKSWPCFCLTVSIGGRWLPAGRMSTNQNVGGYTATPLNDGRVLVAGGSNTAELYDPRTKSWTRTGSLGACRGRHTATLLPDGTVLVTGGMGNARVLQSAEIYDPGTGTWSPAGFMTVPRVSHTATLLLNGLVLVAGGLGDIASSELYDPRTGQFTATGSMNRGRSIHSAVLLPNGRVLVAGGNGGLTAELYDPVTSQWTTTGSMLSSPAAAMAVLLPTNNKVLMPGTPSQLYDPLTGSWSITGSLDTHFSGSASVVLRNGKVLLTGAWLEGAGIEVSEYSAAELYDPVSGVWNFTSSGGSSRTATLLNDGTVLSTGGPWGATEIYDPDASLSVNPAPTVENVQVAFPEGWRTGSETVTLQISGSNFAVGSQAFLGQTVLPITSISSSTITSAVSGSLLACAVNQSLMVRNPPPAGSDSAPFLFKVPFPGPITITAISPAEGAPGTSFMMTVTGTNLCGVTDAQFLPGDVTARVATDRTATSLSLLVTVPAEAAPGARSIRIKTFFSDFSQPFSGFSVPPPPVLPLPVITAITPQTAVARTSFTMTVTGMNLSGATAARFDGFGIGATIQPGGTSTSLSLLVTIGDPLPLGSRTLTITTPAGTSAAFSGFTVLPPSSPPPPPSSGPQPIPEVEDGNVQTGYFVITPDQNTSAPLTTATYGTVRNGIVQDQANVVPLGVTTGATLFINFLNSASRNVGLVIVNPGGTTNAITMTLKNNDGTTASTATVNIDPYKQVAKFVNELFPDPVGSAFMGSINLESGSPFAVLGFPFAGANFSTLGAGNTGTLTGVPTRTLTSGNSGGANAIVLPQFAMGGGWATQVALINTGGTAATGRIDVFDTNGQPRAVKFNGDTRSTFTYSMPAGGSFILAPRDENGQTPM